MLRSVMLCAGLQLALLGPQNHRQLVVANQDWAYRQHDSRSKNPMMHFEIV